MAITNSNQESPIWLWVSVFLGLGWLITIIVFLRGRQSKPPVVVETESDINLKAAVKNLKDACANNDAIAAKTLY